MNLPKFFSTDHNVFGLDINGSSFKLFQFASGKKGLAVQSFTDAPLPKGLIINDDITDAETFAYSLGQALEKPDFGKITTRYAAINLPESKCFVRVIQLPTMKDSEVLSAVPAEAENFIPMPIDQVYLDYKIIGKTDDKENILIVGVPREYVDKYLFALDKCGIIPAILEAESLSCFRSLAPKTSPSTQLIVDLDSLRTNLIVVEGGGVQFSSSIPVAGNTFTESIARALGVSSAKAEGIKKKVGVANIPEYPNIKTALLPVLNNLSGEIKNIIKFHSDHSSSPVEKIILAGGSARLKNLADFLQPFMENIPVELGNPWVNLPDIADNPLAGETGLAFATAIGLAMRSPVLSTSRISATFKLRNLTSFLRRKKKPEINLGPNKSI